MITCFCSTCPQEIISLTNSHPELEEETTLFFSAWQLDTDAKAKDDVLKEENKNKGKAAGKEKKKEGKAKEEKKKKNKDESKILF